MTIKINIDSKTKQRMKKSQERAKAKQQALANDFNKYGPISAGVLNTQGTDWQTINNEVFDKDGFLKLAHSRFWKSLHWESFRLFCHHKALYYIPTSDALAFIKNHLQIDLDSTLEIGAGSGNLGHHLGIKSTDSYLQERPDIRLRYKLMGNQPIIKYGPNVEKIEAIDAIKKYKPNTVIGAWVTYLTDYERAPNSGNDWGIDEDFILDNVDRYIMIGSHEIHNIKPVCKLKHNTFHLDGLVSRRTDNFIKVWER